MKTEAVEEEEKEKNNKPHTVQPITVPLTLLSHIFNAC